MPDWKAIVRTHLAGLKLAGETEGETVDELAQHLEDRYAELTASGMTPEEAERIVVEPLRAPSLVEALQRTRRRAGPEAPQRGNWMATTVYDLRMAFRAMRQKPGFALMVMGMLALGIGGNAAIFSTFNSLFLKPLPFEHSDRLVDLDETAPKWNLKFVGISAPDFGSWLEQNTAFDSIAYFQQPDFNLSQAGPAQHIPGLKTSRGLLDVLRLNLALGRNFTAEEDKPKGERVALLGYDLWQRRFGGDRQVLGKMIVLDEVPYRIVGVLPREAVFPDRKDVWVAAQVDVNRHTGWSGHAIGRLKTGVTVEQARADLRRIWTAQVAAKRSNELTAPVIGSLRERYLGDFRSASQVLLVAVGVVLLIACVNIAALMLVRASARSQEIAIRTAMGASRGRIIRQLLTENAMLAAAGGLAGVLLGRAELQAIVVTLPDTMPPWISFGWDWRFAGFCVLATAAAALLFGLIPALEASRADTRSALHEGAGRSSLSGSRRRMLNVLVTAEVGLALALLVSSGLLLRAFHRVTHQDLGFRPESVLKFAVDLPEKSYAKPQQVVDFYRQLAEQIRVLPGVTGAGAATAPPLGGHWGQFFVAEGDPPLGPEDKTPVVLQVVVTPGYFEAIGITLQAGRWFDAHEGSWQHGVAIVNETFARQHWPGGSAVGKRIKYSYGKNLPWWEVVGVVRNEKHYGLDGEDRPTVYTPDQQMAFPMNFAMVVRTVSNPAGLAEPARRILARMDPDLPMYGVRTMTEQIDRSLWARRAYSWLFGAFSLVALVLAAAGIYSVLSYAVAQRTQEIGIRMAVGASPGEVLAGVLRGGMALVAMGAAMGVAVTLAAAGLLEKLLYGVSPRDPLVYGAGLALVVLVGAVANAVPARRAAGLDPVRALRGS